MGYSKAQKTRTHKRIVSIASRRFREKGLAGFGIAELMKEAGLTHGGFYRHFAIFMRFSFVHIFLNITYFL